MVKLCGLNKIYYFCIVLTPLTVGCDVLYRLNIVIDIIEDSVGMGTRHIEGVYLALCS